MSRAGCSASAAGVRPRFPDVPEDTADPQLRRLRNVVEELNEDEEEDSPDEAS